MQKNQQVMYPEEREYSWQDGKKLTIGKKTLIMGILNVTPDSFSDGGKWNSVDRAVQHMLEMVVNGADIIDIGAESSRPGFVTMSAKEEIEQSPLGDRDKLFMKQLHDIIQQRMSDSDLSVDDIGNLIGLSRAQLYRKVKAMTGLSIVELLRKARLSKAHSMLEAHSMSISEVAYRVGFSAPSYFTKCFKEEYGMLPGDVK